MGQAFEWGSGGTPQSTNEAFYGGDIPWLIIGDLRDKVVGGSQRTITQAGLEQSSAKWVEPGSVLIAMYGSIGKLGIANVELTTNQAIAFTNPRPQEARYLFYYLLRHRPDLAKLGKGGTQQNISQTVIKSFPFVVAPLAEQRRIASAIEEQFTLLDAGVTALERTRANLKRYRASVLKAAVEGRLTERWREQHPDVEDASAILERISEERRKEWEEAQLAKYEEAGKTPPKNWRSKYKEPAAPDTDDPTKLPEKWCPASLEQLTSAARPICYGILMPKENVEDGVPYVKVKDMKGDKIDVEALHRTAPEIAAAYARASLKPKDILLAIRGTYGRIADVPPELDGANITQDTARLDISEQIVPAYVATYLRSATAQQHFKRVARGVAVRGVNIGDVRTTPVALPPFAEQEEIVAEVERRLSVAEGVEAQVEAGLKRAARLRQAILKRAFEGRLVPQDPADESAGVLLERIRIERAASGQPKRKGRTRASRPSRAGGGGQAGLF